MALFRWTENVFPPKRQVVNRVLIVADGILDFCNDSEFGLGELCRVLRESLKPWDAIKVTTAHRSNDPCKCADIPKFTFDMTPDLPHLPFSIQNYDQLWLFGYLKLLKHRIKPIERFKIIEFMNAGGGVFATGDHEDLGVSLCGEIPRVRSMRMWHFPPAPQRNGTGRLDTLRQGTENSFQSTDQSDGTPQEIRPRFSKDSGGKKISLPHPLLCRGKFAVTILPDHMHEGECKLPTEEELNETYLFGGNRKQDYPVEDGNQVKPEIVAISTSAGGFVVDDEADPVEPRAFPIIVAYDGHKVQPSPLGRVAVDSSFHHFVNINLTGSGEPGHTGFFDAQGNPTEHYESIKQYFRNIASWLKPPEQQKRYYLNVLVALRYLSPLIEEVSSSSPYTEQEILFIGTSTRAAIDRHLCSVDAFLAGLTITKMLDEPLQSALRELIDPWREQSANRPHGPTSAIDQELFVKFVLGGAMISIARSLPDDPCEAGPRLDEFEKLGQGVEAVVASGLFEGTKVLTRIMSMTSRTLDVGKFDIQTRSD